MPLVELTDVRIVLLANSQGTAAGSGAGWLVEGEEYPELVRANLADEHEVIPFSRSGWSIDDFARRIDDIIACSPDLVIAQIGIVECTRRILSEREKAFFYRLRGGRRVTKWLHDRRNPVVTWRARAGLTTRVVPLPRFESQLRTFSLLVQNAGSKVLFVEIPPFGSAYEHTYLRFINTDVELYNRALRAHPSVALLGAADDLDGIWQPGTVHFQRHGHRLFADRLTDAIRAYAERQATEQRS